MLAAGRAQFIHSRVSHGGRRHEAVGAPARVGPVADIANEALTTRVTIGYHLMYCDPLGVERAVWATIRKHSIPTHVLIPDLVDEYMSYKMQRTNVDMSLRVGGGGPVGTS
jgi:hypothetical protein